MSELVRKVQRIFGDTSEAQIYVQDIIDWANEAQLEIARQTECLTAILSVDTTTSPPANGFALPVDFITEKRVTYQDQPLTRTSLEELDSLGILPAPTGDTGQPLYYYIFSGKIFTKPTASVLGAAYFKLYYTRSPVLLAASGDSLEVPTHLQEDVTRYCLLRAKELNEDEPAVGRLDAEWSGRMAESREEAFYPHDSYPVVRDVG